MALISRYIFSVRYISKIKSWLVAESTFFFLKSGNIRSPCNCNLLHPWPVYLSFVISVTASYGQACGHTCRHTCGRLKLWFLIPFIFHNDSTKCTIRLFQPLWNKLSLTAMTRCHGGITITWVVWYLSRMGGNSRQHNLIGMSLACPSWGGKEAPWANCVPDVQSDSFKESPD